MTKQNLDISKCPNCQTEFDTHFKYCPECGQSNKNANYIFQFNADIKSFNQNFFNIHQFSDSLKQEANL